MKIGFTGTRHGMSDAQAKTLCRIIDRLKELDEFHHGDCVGADATASVLVFALKEAAFHHIHPASDVDYKNRAKCVGHFFYDPMPALQRNSEIVDACDLLVAVPEHYEEITRSGTWATIRQARKLGKPIVIIWPDGSTTMERIQDMAVYFLLDGEEEMV